MRKSQIERMKNINDLIVLIANTDRKFFNKKHGISKFIELKTTVKFWDGYTQKIITVNDRNKDYGFSHGGTMWGLIKDFKEFIITGKDVNGENGYGGLYCPHWGYSEDGMKKIREKAKEIGYLK